MEEQMCIYDVLVDHGNFDKLLQLIDANDGIRTLLVEEEGPYTFFAPTDDAFDELEKLLATKEMSLMSILSNNELIGKILSHHIVEGELTSDELDSMNTQNITLMDGQSIKVISEDGSIMLGDVNLDEADLIASNGIIQVIDSVMLSDNMEL